MNKIFARLGLILSFLLIFFCGSAQNQHDVYDLQDSSVIPKKKMPQFNEFINGNTNLPPKPRSQWELGFSAGSLLVRGDVASRFQFLKTGATGLSVRKSFGHFFSLRGEMMLWGRANGLDYKPAVNYFKNQAWSGNAYYSAYRQPNGNLTAGTNTPAGIVTRSTGYDPVFYNYRTKLNDVFVEGVFSLNNISFYDRKPAFNVYALVGIGATFYEANIDALNGTQNYASAFSEVNLKYGADFNKNKKQILSELKKIMDGNYDSKADGNYINGDTEKQMKMFGTTYSPAVTAGLGVAYRITNKISIAAEFRNNWTFTDLIDGQRWQEYAAGDAVVTSNFDSYRFASLGIRINVGKKSVAPLWWRNPVDQYSDYAISGPTRMNMPKAVLDDSDSDGVTDQFDIEPNTPAGCPVDSRGRMLDTDADGVPDCKDKEKITPTYCQPVNLDGVGICPGPANNKSTGGTGAEADGSLNKFPWPVPEPTFNSGPKQLNSTQIKNLNDAKQFLEMQLKQETYEEASFQYYSVPGGFAMVAPLEQIEDNGAPKSDPPRWTITTDLKDDFSISKYLSALIFGNKGYYRVMVFMYTNLVPTFESKKSGQPIINLSGGKYDLPAITQMQPVNPNHKCYVLVYEFEQEKSGNMPVFVGKGKSGLSFTKHFGGFPVFKKLFK